VTEMSKPIRFILVVTAVLVGICILLTAFVRSRGTSPLNACRNNLRCIDNAKEQFAVQHNSTNGTVITEADITQFMKGFKMPICPENGQYRINAYGVSPSCSRHGVYPMLPSDNATHGTNAVSSFGFQTR
jgi:hypothetical protein